MDTGDIHQFQAFELFSLNEIFSAIPNQAYYLHLTGITPADMEEDWDPRVYAQIEKYLSNFFKNEKNLVYEGKVLFSVRNTIVVDIIRLINHERGIVHCSVKKFLLDKGFGIPTSTEKVIEMAKGAGRLLFLVLFKE